MRTSSYFTLLLLLVSFVSYGKRQGTNDKMKAVFMYNFTRYVEWPVEKQSGTFDIVFLGDTIYPYQELEKVAATKKAIDRDIVVHTVSTIEEIDLGSTDMLYLDARSGIDIDAVMAYITGNNILLVTNGFKEGRSMINFKTVRKRQKFELNPQRLKYERFQVSDGLLSLAINVEDKSYYGKEKSSTSGIEAEEEPVVARKRRNTAVDAKTSTMAESYTTTEEEPFEFIKEDEDEEQFMKDFAMLFEELEGQMEGNNSQVTLNQEELSLVIGQHQKQVETIEQSQQELTSLKIETEQRIEDLNVKKQELKRLNQEKEEKEKEIERKQKVLEEQTSLISSQKTIIYLFAGLLIVISVLTFIGIKQYKKTQEANKQIQKQKEEVEHQKHIVEEKNQEITDSINYARRIQTAILPPDKLVAQYLENSFILYKPKDIVAGDFYWMEIIGDEVIFAAADCTGHGVPGAMVSVVCHGALNRSVREFGLKEPASILDKTRELVIETFEKSEEEVKDGMDIALCKLNTKTNELHFSGANNPLYKVSGGELTEIKADKQPIGKYDDNTPFTNHKVDLAKGDTIYVFTDGYADQFGGPKGKKFKYKPFKELLLSAHLKPHSEQKQIIDRTFEDWRKGYEQVDDVCVIGFSV